MPPQSDPAVLPQTAPPAPQSPQPQNHPPTPAATQPVEPDQLAALLEDYLVHLIDYRNSSPRTVTAYRADLRHFLDFCHGLDLTRPSDLERRHLHQYAAILPASGKRGRLAPASVARKIHALRSWFGFLCDLDLLQSNLAAGLRLPQRDQRLPRVPTEEEARAMLAATRTPREQALLGVMLMAGLRRGEVLALNVESVSADLGQMLVWGKGNKERIVPISPTLRVLLEAHLEQRGVVRGPLFLGRTGQRMTVTSFNRVFQGVLRRAGLEGEGLTPHKCRHYFATALLRQATDIATVAELLGHSNISTTSVYTHASPHTKRTAVDSLQWGPDPAGAPGSDEGQVPPPPGPAPAAPALLSFPLPDDFVL